METIGRCGKITDADMAAYVREENEAQLSEQAEQEYEDRMGGDFDDIENQIAKDEADEELKAELKREKAKLVAEAGARMKEKVAAINAEFSPTKLDGIIVDTRDWLFTNPRDILQANIERGECNVPLSDLLSPIEIMQANRHIGARNWRRN